MLTIDPARRLAQSMGIEALDNTPRPVHDVATANGGSLDAMMLDMKRTFDEVVESQATPEKAKQILENPFYIALSSSFAGTQEYMAMEKLGQIHRDAQRDGTYDLIVVDTPPSRSALDFLDAPERLSSFLDGRFIRLLLAPARGPAKLMSAGFGLITERPDQDPRHPGAARHADVRRRLRHAVRRLPPARAEDVRAAPGRRHGVPRGRRARAGRAARGGVLRRAARARTACRCPGWSSTGRAPRPQGALSADEAMAAAVRLRKQDPDSLTAGLLRLHADQTRMVEREALLRDRFATAHPEVPTAVVPALAGDVHDLDGLRRVGELLADG